MKIGAITDIHNNVTALKAVMEKFTELGVEKTLCCGDIIGIGPYPEKTVRYVMSIPELEAVKGNHDRYLTDGLPDRFPNEEDMGEGEAEHHRWEHGLLSADSVRYIKSLPLRRDMDICGHRISIMHYCMNCDGKYTNYTLDPAGEDLERMFESETADIILYGHDHKRCITEHGSKFYVNPGSLGCPSIHRNIARCAVLDISKESVSVEAMDIPYPAESVVADIDRFAYSDYENIKKYFYGV